MNLEYNLFKIQLEDSIFKLFEIKFQIKFLRLNKLN